MEGLDHGGTRYDGEGTAHVVSRTKTGFLITTLEKESDVHDVSISLPDLRVPWSVTGYIFTPNIHNEVTGYQIARYT